MTSQVNIEAEKTNFMNVLKDLEIIGAPSDTPSDVATPPGPSPRKTKFL